LTTALRFHPLEIALFILIELGIIVALEGSQVTMMLFEVVLNATAMFSHGNIYLPERLDRILRGRLVTLDMRRSHHSIYLEETNRTECDRHRKIEDRFAPVVLDRVRLRASEYDLHYSKQSGGCV
jgi:hypothetical protein